jgi:hypothetical protein
MKRNDGPVKREEREERTPGSFAKMKKTLSEGIRKLGKGAKVATLAAGVGALAAGCGEDTPGNNIPIPDGGVTDADMTDGRTGDADISDGSTGDSGMVDGSTGDAMVDGSTGDSGMVDAGVSDSSVADTGSTCSVSAASVSHQTVNKGSYIAVGGYHITYVQPTSSGVTLDVGCGGSLDNVESDKNVSMGTASGTTITDTANGMTITITAHSKNTWHVVLSVTVASTSSGGYFFLFTLFQGLLLPFQSQMQQA